MMPLSLSLSLYLRLCSPPCLCTARKAKCCNRRCWSDTRQCRCSSSRCRCSHEDRHRRWTSHVCCGTAPADLQNRADGPRHIRPRPWCKPGSRRRSPIPEDDTWENQRLPCQFTWTRFEYQLDNCEGRSSVCANIRATRTWSQMHVYPSEEPLFSTHTPCSPQSASEFSVLQIDVFCVQWRPNHPGRQSHLYQTDVIGMWRCIREIAPQPLTIAEMLKEAWRK